MVRPVGALIYLGGWLRALGDVVLFAYVPIHIFQAYGEQRLQIISLTLAVPALVRAAAAPWWGRQLDRTARQRIVFATGLAGYAVILGLLALLPGSQNILLWLTWSAAVPGAAVTTAARTWCLLIRPGSLTNLARWFRWEAGGYLVGGISIGAGISAFGITSVATIIASMTALTSILSFVLLADVPLTVGRLRKVDSATDKPPVRRRRERVASPRSAAITLAAAFLFLATLAWEGVYAIYGVYLTQALGAPLELFGLTITGATLVAMLTYGPAAKLSERSGAPLLFLLTIAAYAAGYTGMITRQATLVALAYLVPASAFLRSAVHKVIVDTTSPRQRGRAVAGIDTVEAIAAMVGALSAGWAADSLGLITVPRLALMVIPLLLACLLLMLWPTTPPRQQHAVLQFLENAVRVR